MMWKTGRIELRVIAISYGLSHNITKISAHCRNERGESKNFISEDLQKGRRKNIE